MPVTLILGGARSGKSRRAEALALSLSERPVYVATAPMIDGDEEWAARIECHRKGRDACWQVIEEQQVLADVLRKHAGAGQVVLVDCLTLWLFNLMSAGKDAKGETARLCELMPTLAGQIILVANEVGMGLVPDYPEGRAFRDAQGRMNQAVAAAADKVEFMVAGLSICMKGENK